MERITVYTCILFAAFNSILGEETAPYQRVTFPPASVGLYPLVDTDNPKSPVLYWVSLFSLNVTDAEMYCSESEKQLVTLDTEQKESYIEQLFVKNNFIVDHWTSGKKNVEGKWIWENGEEISYNKFKSAEKADTAGNNCLLLRKIDDLYHWGKKNCAEEYRFICEH